MCKFKYAQKKREFDWFIIMSHNQSFVRLVCKFKYALTKREFDWFIIMSYNKSFVRHLLGEGCANSNMRRRNANLIGL